jgi:signal transduction histidine kinase
LISNAIKYSPEDSTVVIRARQEDGHLVCRIVDQGRGMNDQEMGEAFTRFYRSPSVRKTAVPGMGLGLPIAKAIVEQHGGNIGFESTPAKGTVVSFTLPLHQEIPADSRIG